MGGCHKACHACTKWCQEQCALQQGKHQHYQTQLMHIVSRIVYPTLVLWYSVFTHTQGVVSGGCSFNNAQYTLRCILGQNTTGGGGRL